jgi:hypothetical protein
MRNWLVTASQGRKGSDWEVALQMLLNSFNLMFWEDHKAFNQDRLAAVANMSPVVDTLKI